MPPEVQALVQEVAIQDSQADIKSLQAALKDLGKAKKALSETLAARKKMYGKWQEFLGMSVKKWQEYMANFAAQDAIIKEKIAGAKETLTRSKDHFEQLQKASGGGEVLVDSDVEEEMKVDAGTKIAEGMTLVLQNLQQIETQTSEELQSQQSADRERTPRRKNAEKEEPPEEDRKVTLTASSAPFGVPG